ncbi:MAG: elongation factor G [Clostridia bacterium]|nr:elongation factor G [Clostridia bacterium]
MSTPAKDIRNICLIGHKGNGKTALAEAMLYFAKKIERLGKTEQGNTVLDFDAEEIKRKFSIALSMASFEYKEKKINLIDVPGNYDYEGDQISGLEVADIALIVLNAKNTVSVGTEKAWQKVEERAMPRAFFVGGIDDANADFYSIVEQLHAKFGGTQILPITLPIMEDGKMVGTVNIVTNEGYRFGVGECPVPANMQDKVNTYYHEALEAIAETDDALMDKFFSEEEFTPEELEEGVKKAIAMRLLYPVYCGVPTEVLGIYQLLHSIVHYFPNPLCKGDVTVHKNGEDVQLACDPAGPMVLRVFKTVADPFVGKMSFFKVYSGTVKKDGNYLNPRKGEFEKIAHVYTPFGKKQIEVSSLEAGDIGVFTKLALTATSDTLCDKDCAVEFDPIKFPKANYSKAVVSLAKGDEEKIAQGINRMIEEDPSLKFEVNPETKQMVLSGFGDLQLDVVVSKLASKFGVKVNLEEVKVPYREAIRKKVKVEGKHKKQSGGHGQYGHVWIEFEPLYDGEFEFAESVFGGAVPKNYFPAVEKGLRESITKGVLAGYPVTGLKATLLDGSYHPVDSSEMAFKTAASIAFKEGMKAANPVLLEPVGTLKVLVSDALMGDIIGDINKRRGQILSMDAAETRGYKVVSAIVPISEMNSYAMDLRSMTHARASFELSFLEYREAPANITQKVIAEKAE